MPKDVQYFKIPARYTDAYIFSATLFHRLNYTWNHNTIKAQLRDPEFRELYERNRHRYVENDRREIASYFGLAFVVDDGTDIEPIGQGPQIYLRINKRQIFFTYHGILYIPEGCFGKSRKIYERLDGVLEWLGECDQGRRKRVRVTGETIIEPCPFISKKFRYIEKKYNISINIWEKSFRSGLHQYNVMRTGAFGDHVEITLHYDRIFDKYFLVTDEDKYFKNLLRCKNVDNGCLYTFANVKRLKEHEKKCETLEESQKRPKIIQKEFGPSTRLINKAIDFGLFSKFPSNENFLFFDIECVLPKTFIQKNKSVVICTHKFVSIAVNSFINNEHTQKVWVVENSSAEAETDIIESFLKYCYSEYDRMEKNCDALDALDRLSELSDTPDSFFNENELYELKRLLEPFTELPVFGYNNSKYDNNVIFSHIVKTLDHDKFNIKDVKLLKKGTRYFSIKFNNLHFKDLMNFTCPVSLDKYLKTWTRNFSKLVYPYEHFESIDQIRGCLEFPEKDHFFSTLKGPVDDELYNLCKIIYNEKHGLPASDPEHWPNFESYLKHYNVSDVYPASCGLITQFKTYTENFGLSPMQSLGLPSFARAAMFKLYDAKCPSIFTFPASSDATRVFRENVIGGLCNVYARHVTTTDETASYSAKYSNQGNIEVYSNYN